MKNKRQIAEFVMILSFIFDSYHLSVLCKYGGTRRHLLWMFFGLLVFSGALILRQTTQPAANKSKTAFIVKLTAVIAACVLFSSSIIYSAIPYNGKLAWKIQDLIHTREVALTHTNIFDTGIEGILVI